MNSKGHPATASHAHDQPTLGEIKVDAFEQDVLINDRHQAFSAELLRLALLGVGGVGYVASRALAGSSSVDVALRMGVAAKWLVLIAAVSFGLSAASALCLRYLASDLIAFQLRIVRLRIRGRADDGSQALLRNPRRKTRKRRTTTASTGKWRTF
jgi:hypothetical protein